MCQKGYDSVIDERVSIHPTAKIASDVHIGPWSVIGPHVEIGAGCRIGPHVVIHGPTKIGCNNEFFQFSSIGERSQDLKYTGEPTWLEIGDNNIFREFCTINRGTAQNTGITRIGSHNVFLAYVHVAHDCVVGNYNIFSNGATLAGHVSVEDHVIFGGISAVHQFCHVGAHSFISGGSMVPRDVLPYTRVIGALAKPFGLNSEGLKRRQFSTETVNALRRAYKIIYRAGLTTAEIKTELASIAEEFPEVQHVLAFFEQSERGIVR